MDRVKAILKVAGKYHFWIVAVVAMIVALVGWYMARNALTTAYNQKKGEIVSKFMALDGVRAVQPHPNGNWTTEVGKLNEEEKAKVKSAWDKVYSDQKLLLEWPKSLGDDFLKFVAEHPASPDNPAADLPLQLRERYSNHIKAEFPHLPAIVDAAPIEAPGKISGASPAARGGKPAPPPEPVRESRVVWEGASQQHVQQSLEFTGTPSAMQVRQAQEDLWIYSALLKVIRATNEGATYTPRIKVISSLLIGLPAADAFEGGMASNHIEQKAGGDAPPPASAPAAPAVEGAVPQLDAGRYVDADGKKLPGGPSADKQFKRMPIAMKLIMDQREIPRLLVQCANSPLPIEVRQLRIGVAKSSGSVAARPQGGSRASASAGGGSTAPPATEAESYDVPVEIMGIIYVYNPPDASLSAPAAAPAAAALAPGDRTGEPRRRWRR